jgi:hypothetical protein
MSVAYQDPRTKVLVDQETVSVMQEQKTDVCIIVSRAAWREIVNGVTRELEQEREAKT